MKKFVSLLLIFCLFIGYAEDYEIVNNNKPYDDLYDYLLYGYGFEQYSGFDSRGRAGVAVAWVCEDTMPMEGQKRPSLTYRPTGWKQARYDFVPGKYIYNRCHLIAWCLTAEGNNKYNLVTGTQHMNQDVMTDFELLVRDYVKETGGSVLYRVTPEFKFFELICRSIRIEAASIYDDEICFHVRIYNQQEGIQINYRTGETQSITP